MAVCYFNRDYDKIYDCEYKKRDNEIEVNVNYEIDEEILATNGAKTFSTNTNYKERDILIIDYENKMNYLLKDAYHNGHSEVYGTPDGGCKTKFSSKYYFTSSSYEKLMKLKTTPKIKKIRIYSNFINEVIGTPSLYEEDFKSEFVIKLKKMTDKNSIQIGKNNIGKLTVSDDWNHIHSYKNNNITIKLNGYLEIDILKKINYDFISEYIRELAVYLQLLRPDKLNINKIAVIIDDEYYEYSIPIDEIKYNNKIVSNSVSDDLLLFLSNCYKFIPYRNSKTEVRNIPYIILNTSRNLEDNFLMFYRFIECYYKKQKIKNISSTFISYSIINNYNKNNKMTSCDLEKITQEIISLRNHYAHSGYYIKNNSLKISFKEVEGKKEMENYTVNNADFEWIYYRTKILYDIVIDIIFSSMLNYNDYKFTKHF